MISTTRAPARPNEARKALAAISSPTAASVIICTYSLERWPILTRAVAALRDQTLAPREVIVVVDNNEALRTRAADELDVTTVIASCHPGGAAGARLTGAREAQSPILAFLDDDAIVDRDWLEKLLEPLGKADVLGVGGFLDPLWEVRPPGWLPHEFYWVVGCTFPGISSDGVRMRNPIAANMAVRAEVYARTGGMAAELGRTDNGKRVSGTAEETELSIRAANLYPNTYWAYAPEARVSHFVPASRTTFSYFVRRCRLEGTAKAVLTRMLGTESGLASERNYVLRILPGALAANMRQALHGDARAALRAGAVLTGAMVTTIAFVAHRMRLELRSLRPRVISAPLS